MSLTITHGFRTNVAGESFSVFLSCEMSLIFLLWAAQLLLASEGWGAKTLCWALRSI